MAAISAKRTADLAKYGRNNEKEAQGLRLISRAMWEDGRLECHRSFEGARADFCVYPKDKPGSSALGIQLKTTGVNYVQAEGGTEYYMFRNTTGYTGLLMFFVALHAKPTRIWLADGSRVVSKNVPIPVNFQQGTRSDHIWEVDLATLADTIYAIYDAAILGPSNYLLRSREEHEKPEEGNRLVEYNAFKRLQLSLPLLFVDPPAEHMSFDYLVDGKKWQLKLARYYRKGDVYLVTCSRKAGTVGGKQTYRQYEVNDFDFLCIQLPENSVDCCYVIPQGVLESRGVIGDATKLGGAVTLYPHRPTARRFVHTTGVHWAEAYRVDFSVDPLAKLARITVSSCGTERH